MQRAIRILRLALPVVFLAFILLIVLSWNRAKVGKEKIVPEPLPQTRTGVAIAVSKKFEDTQTVGGRVVSHIVADRVIAYKSQWNTLENVRLTLYRENGLSYELTCPQAEFNSETKEANAQGGVRVTSSDGVDISTAQIHYDGNRLTNNIPVQFAIDRWRGTAGAVELDVQAETLHLAKRVDATMTPLVQTEPPMTIKAADGVFRRRENDVNFAKDVVLTRGADVLSGDRMSGKFTPDRRTLVAMEGAGHIKMVMSGDTKPGEDLGGRKTIDCQRFFSELGPDGQIAAINAVGEPGLAHAVLDGPPSRDIVARTFRVALRDRAVQEIKAEWNVVIKETGDTPRESRADHVIVGFDPARHRAVNALIEGNFKYHDPKTDATAVRANYDIVNDRVLLTAIPGFDPSVTSEGSTVKAKQIEFSPKAQTAKATGEVIAQLVSRGGSDATNIFPGGGEKQPVYVNSDTLLMRQANRQAVFSGNVKAWQVNNTLLAQDLQIQGNGDVITARGAVRTVLYNAGTENRKVPVLSKSDQLIARRNDRKLELLGNVQIDDDTRTLTGERATFFFDANRKIERVEAENKVVVVEKPTSRKMTGDKATYYLARKMVYVDGSPATATGPQGNVSGQQIKLDLARNHLEVVSPTGKTELNYKQP